MADATTLPRLLAPTPAQCDYLAWLIEIMEEDELQQLVLQLFRASAPLDRQGLLDDAAKIVGQQRFRDGWRRSRRGVDGKRA